MAARNHIDLIVKTMKVLETLAEHGEGAGLKDIASRVGLIKSSVFRILFTLKELGYVEQTSDSGPYRLTFKTTALVRKSAERPTLMNLARPQLMRLRDSLQETVWLAELRRHGVVLVDFVEAPHPLKLAFDVGDVCPVHATALGKAIAAYLTPKQLDVLLQNGKLPKLTSRTLTSRSELRTELERVRQRGYSTNNEESTQGVFLVGAPLFDSFQRVFAAISASAPTVRCSSAKRKAMAEQVLATSQEITRQLREASFRASEHSL